MTKRVLNSFIRKFIVRNEEEHHWIPASIDNGPLQNLFQKLVKGCYIGAKRTRFAAIKTIYFSECPSGDRRGIARLRTRPADAPGAPPQQVSAFVGWRFPAPLDELEMEPVRKWISDFKHTLKVGSTEAITLCLETFHSYKKIGDKYCYSTYPSIGHATVKSSLSQPSLSVPSQQHLQWRGSTVAEAETTAPVSSENAILPMENSTVGVAEQYARKIVGLARNDNVFRSLKLVLSQPPTTQLSVVCGVWTMSVSPSHLSECSNLERDFFEFCQLLSRHQLQTDRFLSLRTSLNHQFEDFRLARESLGLPLFVEDSWC